ncbi:MAG: dienelactone hydrolase family protein [Alphaproteobacteria bacterium]|nr:dienelactone hydrolase family protein [Alphaproteobacteria bacterium]
MLTEQILPPQNGGKPKSAVILLHGLGDSGAGLIGLGEAWRSGLPETEFLAPDAPFPCDMAPFGYQWFGSEDWSPSVVLAGVKKAGPYLDDYIDHVMASRNLAPDRIALVGFSQGTIMALYVAPRRTPPLAGVIGYSGALVGGESLPQERKSSPPILLVHGMKDDVIRFPAMLHAQNGLQNANITVATLARPDLYHSIDDAGLAEGLRFLRKVLA